MQLKPASEQPSVLPMIFVIALFLLHVFAFVTGLNSFPLTDYSLYSQHQTLSDFGVYRILATDEHSTEHSVTGGSTYGYSNLIYLSLQGGTDHTEYLIDQKRWITVPPISELIGELQIREHLPFTPTSIRIVHTTAYECGDRICIHDDIISTH